MSEIEDVIRRLRELSLKKPLSSEELEEAKRLMSRLREFGFTNREVSILTGGGWSEPTVKLYTRGTRVLDPSPRDKAIALLGEIVDRGLSIKDIEKSVQFIREIESRGLRLGDVISLVEDVKRFGEDIKGIVEMFIKLKSSGIDINILKSILSYRAELESMGIDIDILKKLCNVVKRFGGLEGVLSSIELYESINGIRAEIDRLSKERDRISGEVESLRQIVKSLEDRRKSAEDVVRIYEEIQRMGFDAKSLEDLRSIAERFGGVGGVLEALKSYGDISSMKSEIEKLKKVKESLEVDVKKLNADYAHLQTVISICDKLLYEYRFSISAIETLYRVAKTYGEPIEVLKALEKFGELKKIESEVENLLKRREELESRIKELESNIIRLRGSIEEMYNVISKELKDLLREVKNSVKGIVDRFTEAIGRISSEYEGYVKRFGELKAEAGKLEEELALARAIQALIRYPSEAKNIPIDYDIMMIEAIIKHCIARGVNPRVRPPDSIREKYYSTPSIDLIDILKWAREGLIEALGGGR